jgi:hypothetical protein
VNLDISTNFSRRVERILVAGGRRRDTNGFVIQGTNQAYISVTNTVTLNGLVYLDPTIRGTAVGRVAAHEMGHALGLRHGTGLMRTSNGSELFDLNSGPVQFRFSQADIIRLRRRCQR